MKETKVSRPREAERKRRWAGWTGLGRVLDGTVGWLGLGGGGGMGGVDGWVDGSEGGGASERMRDERGVGPQSINQ